MTVFPSIDMLATGNNIKKIRIANGLSVKDLQDYFGFDQPQAIYKWQWGDSLPSIDNLYALSKLFHVSIDEILVGNNQDFSILVLCILVLCVLVLCVLVSHIVEYQA